jgi:RHS repeat-associated protein
MLNTKPSIYGTGWHISNTEFDMDRLTLTLLSGESYKTQSLPMVGSNLIIKDRKLKDLVVNRPDENTLHVIYKDGTVEILKRHSSSVPYRINAIQFENGQRLIFRYAFGRTLECILNDVGEELVVLTYSSGGNLSMIDTRVEGARYSRVRFSYNNGLLTGVTAPYDRNGAPGEAAYVFSYTSFRNDLVALTGVKHPTGGEEQVTYTENGHAYGHNQYIPRVLSWMQTPGANQSRMVRKYSYSPNSNFTGYPYSGGFKEGEDNLYLVHGDYTYWTDETSIDVDNNDNVLMTTRTTYNKFHLLTEELILREGTRTTQILAYNAVPGLFPVQPANLQLPKTITKRYDLVAGGVAREEVQHIETDDYGNELSRTEPSGVRTEYSYYSIAGEDGKCPADPHGLFQRYLKQERIIPAGGSPAARLTEYTHTRVPQTGPLYTVLQQSSKQSGVFAVEQTYYETPIALAGRLKSITSTIGGQSLTSDFTYTVTGDTLGEVRRLQGREGQWLEARRTLSLVNRRLLSMTRDGGSTLALTFDVNGRLTTETVSPDTPHEATRRYAYHYAAPNKRAHLITTDAQGNQAITYYDGMGRQVSEAQLMAGGQERVTATWRYDALGQTVEAVSYDYLSDGHRVLKTIYAYNRWGNVSRVTRPDGRVQIDEYDPQLHLTIEGEEGGERRRTYFNEHSQPVKVERVDSNNVSVELESRAYDGLGRCLSVLDISKNLTSYTYDLCDRPLTMLQTPSDDTPQRSCKIDYAPGTCSQMISALTMEGITLGSRTYDSLGRMTGQKRGKGPSTTWEYETGWVEPVAMISPRGVRQTLAYGKELDVLSRIEMTGHPVSTYQHDPIVGAFRRSETDGLIHEMTWDANGYPEKDIQTAGDTSFTTQYGYSPAGRLLHQTDNDGQRSELDYDEKGRFIRMTTGSMVIEQSYDTFARPQQLTTTYESTQVITKMSYDSLGREVERRFEQNGSLLQVMTSTYENNGMLATRFLRDASSRVVIGETFTYDGYLRLKTYCCEGLEHPRDHLGRGIIGQSFSFDSLDNITRVLTSFADGTQDSCERFFTGADPTQLTRVTHTLPAQDLTLTYDAAGNLQTGPAGQSYTYNGVEQLTAVQVGPMQYSYRYDAESRQVSARRNSESSVTLAYSGDRLDTLVEGGKKIRYHDGEDQVLARTGGVDGPQLHINDASGSVRGISAPGQPHVRRHYTPYGNTYVALDDGRSRTMADLQLPAFNGQRLDAAVNLYFLGNGQRAYDPDLMLFLQPDPLSPFDEGGVNSYGYCAGNPINMADPSGLWPNWLKWVLTGAALALSIVTLGYAAPALAAAMSAYVAQSVLFSSVAGALATAAVAAPSAAAVAVPTAAAAASAMAAKGAFLAGLAVVSKATAAIGAGLGVVGGTLSVTALSIAEVDRKMGWDRSNHINNLGWASLGFSIASLAMNLGGAYISAHTAFGGAAKNLGTELGKAPMRSALSAGGKRLLGLSYKFTDKGGVTTFSKAFGVTRTVLRFTNLGRSIQGRITAGASSSPGDGTRDNVSSAQPLRQSSNSSWIDMQNSSSDYYQSFREEASRVRQPLLQELTRG